MEVVIFIGLQASGKSSFFRERFFETHVRVNLDMLRTRNRERILIDACFRAKQSFVVDNTNLTAEERGKIIALAQEHQFHVIGYYFRSSVSESLARNAKREGKARIPERGILASHKRLEVPQKSEGFDALYYVQIGPGGFEMKEWDDEV